MPTVTQREQRAVQQRGIPTAEGSSSVADERRGGQLLEQFSSLLDQISIQLEQAQSAEAIAPAPLVAPSRKAEALPQQLQGEGSEAFPPSQEEGKAEVKEPGAAHEVPVSEGESAAPEEHEVAADAETEEAPQALAVEIPSESEPEDVVAEAPLPEGVIPVVLETEELVSPELLVEAEEPTGAEVAPVLVEAATVESLAPEQEVVSPSSGTAAASLGEQPKVVEGEKVLASPQGELASGEGGAPSETFSKPEQLPPTLPRDLSEPKGESEHIMREVKELFDAAGRFSASTPQAPREGAEESALVRAFHSALQERAPQTPLQAPGDQPLPQQGASLAPSPRSEFFSSLFSGSASRSGGELPFGKVGDIVTQMQSRGDSNPQGNTGGQLGLGEKIKTASEKMEKAVTEELSKGQELRTMEKVEEALKEVARSRDGRSISLRLDPPSLGSVRVDVSLREGALHARLAADNAQVNALLRERGQELQQMLRALGLEVDSVSVSVRDDGAPARDNASQFSQQHDFQEHLREHHANARSAPDGVLAEHAPSRSESSSHDDHWVA